ncbi:COG3522 Predicted component of the type VI protein secretion system [Rhabdaerophilaceae bacterium]
MSITCKPVWSEGMLIRPQHFQQFDRWIEHSFSERAALQKSFGWGVGAIEFSTELLPLGRLSISRLKAVMPDGTMLDMPAQVQAPAPRSLPSALKNTIVKLALPVRAMDGAELSGEDGIRRYTASEQSVRDTTAPDRASLALRVKSLTPRLILDGEPNDDCVTIALARVREVDASGGIQLDAEYVPPCLDIHASPRLVQIINDVRSLLKMRGDALASGLDLSRSGSDAATALDMMVLSVINSREPIFDHLASLGGQHPERVYLAMCELAGALMTFSPARRREREFPAYNHLDLNASLMPILDAIRQQLAVVIERNTLALPLQDRGYGVRTAMIADRTIFQDCQFVLVAFAAMPAETLRATFPTTVKIGSVEQIRELVNLQLPGIPLQPLPVAPRALPFIQNAVYFELDQRHELWRSLVRSAAFAFHVSGELPDLSLEFWAIRGQRR